MENETQNVEMEAVEGVLVEESISSTEEVAAPEVASEEVSESAE